MDSYRCDSDL